jgi:hypothetical protein
MIRTILGGCCFLTVQLIALTSHMRNRPSKSV